MIESLRYFSFYIPPPSSLYLVVSQTQNSEVGEGEKSERQRDRAIAIIFLSPSKSPTILSETFIIFSTFYNQLHRKIHKAYLGF